MAAMTPFLPPHWVTRVVEGGVVIVNGRGAPSKIIKQTWWKRAGAWLGGGFVLQGVLALRSPFSDQWWGLFALVFGVAVLILGWRQGVEVSDRGIETRRLARRTRRGASWADIDRFDRDLAPVAVLRDGTKLRLFDWAGDSEAVLEALEAERRLHQP
jgi:hypothetical protein